jgi:hypothetical protein
MARSLNIRLGRPALVIAAALAAAAGGAVVYSEGSGGACEFPSCFPDATNTGVPSGTSLTAYSGPTTITADDTVIDGKIVDGCLRIQADGVIIRNSRVSCEDDGAIGCFADEACGTTTELLIEDTDVDCTGEGSSGIVGQGTAITADNFIARRVNIQGCENGLSVAQNVLIEDSYIHDLYNDLAVPLPDGAHADGIQFSSDHYVGPGYSPGALDITIRHNTIYANGWDDAETELTLGTSSIITNRGPTNIDENILIEKNLLAGGGVAVYCEQDGYSAINEDVIDNHFSTVFEQDWVPPHAGEGVLGDYPSADCANEDDTSGNVIHESGDPLVLD